MKAEKLPQGGTIGIFCPSHVADPQQYAAVASAIKRLGFNVKFGPNMYKDTYGYAAGAEERAEDLNFLAAADDVKAVLFSGGESAVEILPFIDYDGISRRPKLFGSYSDGTSILNAIYARTGLITYYGVEACGFSDLRLYNYTQFCSHFVEGYSAERFVSDGEWTTLRGGVCRGTLIGGYTSLFGLMLANRYFSYDASGKYLLFLEDHEKFSNVGAVSTYLSFIEQSAFMETVVGLIFGHYSVTAPDTLLRLLERFGAKNNIPVVYTDDFGHGTRHAVLPIGVSAELDAGEKTLSFIE